MCCIIVHIALCQYIDYLQIHFIIVPHNYFNYKSTRRIEFLNWLFCFTIIPLSRKIPFHTHKGPKMHCITVFYNWPRFFLPVTIPIAIVPLV